MEIVSFIVDEQISNVKKKMEKIYVKERSVQNMSYVIVNKYYGVKLDKKGKPMSCKKGDAQIFEYSKAKNICDTLPKTMKNLRFHVEPVTDFQTSTREAIVALKKTYKPEVKLDVPKNKKKLVSTEYEMPDSVQQWIEKIKTMNGLITEAQSRKDELLVALSNADKERTNIEHEIEIFSNLNASEGYKKYRELRKCLLRRRIVKDELKVVSLILDTNNQEKNVVNIDKFVNNLEHRSFTYREVVNE